MTYIAIAACDRCKSLTVFTPETDAPYPPIGTAVEYCLHNYMNSICSGTIRLIGFLSLVTQFIQPEDESLHP